MTPLLGPPSTIGKPARARVLVLWLAFLALATVLIVRTPFVADLSAFLPSKPDARQQVLVEQLQSGVAARTLLIGIDGGTAQQRAEASRALAKAMRSSGHFQQVQNGENEGFAEVGRWLLERRYALSPAIDPARFTAAGLRDGIDENLSLLGTPAGNLIKGLLDRDPTGETQRIAETLIPAQAPRSEHGVWASREAGRAVLMAQVAGAGADLDAQAAALDSTRQAFAALTMQGLELRLSGAPVFSVESRARIEREAKLLAMAGTVLVCALLWVAFASLPALLVALLPVGTGVLTGIAAVSLVFGKVHGVTLGFGSTLIGEAVDYAIYYLIQARATTNTGLATQPVEGWRAWLQHSWPTVRLGLLTSLCGFAALVFSGFPGLAQLGVFSMSGLLGAALATRYLMPILMPNGAQGQGMRKVLGRFAMAALRALPRWKAAFLVLGALAAALLFGQGKSLWHADLASLSPISPQAIALDESLRADLTANDGGSLIVVKGNSLEETLQRAEHIGKQLDGLVNEGKVTGYNSVTRWLPSLATQNQRLAALPDAANLRTALTQATAGSPLDLNRLAPFMADVEAARQQKPITLADLQGSALAPLVDALLILKADGKATALIPVQLPSGTDLRADGSHPELQAALQGAEGTQLLAIKPELDRMYASYLGEAQTQTGLGALAVVAIMALWLRSWRRLLAVCLPLVLAVVLTLGLLSLLQSSLGILHLVGLLLVVAVGSNYALFFDMLQNEQAQALSESSADTTASTSSVHDTLASLLLANLTTVLSFALIALSSIPALSAIGAVVAPGALLAMVLAAAFARPRTS